MTPSRPGTGHRLAGVDAARGVALLGMAAVHVLPARGDDGSTHVAHLVAGGRSAALFALLAGVGVALASGGRRPVRGRARTRWSVALLLRAAVVGLVGLLLAELETGVAVVLAYYAVLFAVAVPLVGLRVRVLAGLGVGVALLAPLLSLRLRDGRPRAPVQSPGLDALTDPLGLLEVLLLTGYYPVLGWTAYLCAGLAVGRLALASRRTAALLLGGGAALAAAASAASAVLLGPLGGYAALEDVGADRAEVDRARFGTVPTDSPWWLATDAAHSTTPPDLLHTTGTALAALGLALLVAPRLPRLLGPLAAAGSMPLTLYSAHLVVLALLDDPDPLRSWLAQAAGALLLAWLWRRHVGRGPLEALLAEVSRRVAGRA